MNISLNTWFNHLNGHNIKGDIFGGLTAAVIALPLALAFGVSSGAGAIAGVYGAIFVGFFAALFGGTATQVSGPTGPMTIVMAIIITQMIAVNPTDGISLAFSAVIIAGIIQIAFGLLGLGKYFVMVPYAVISGFMTGIGVIIILLEFAPLLGVNGYSSVIDSVQHLPDTFANLNPIATTTGFVTLAIVVFWPKAFARYIPSPLFALLATTIVVTLFLNDGTQPIIGDIPSGFPDLKSPQLSFSVLDQVLYYAVLLAILGSIDSLLTSMVADTMTESHHNSNKELIGQGIGNTVAGFFGALPGAGATMRTAINIRAGGSTALSGIIHSLTLLVIVLWAGKYAQYIPHAVLAGMLMKVGIDIIDWQFLGRFRQIPPFSLALMILVLLLTVFVDLITAVVVGMFIANLVTLDRLSHIQLDNISFIKANTLIMNSNNTLDNTLIFEIDGPISFAVSRQLSQRFSETHQFNSLIIDLSKAHLIGCTTAVIIIDLIESSQAKNKEVLVVLGNEKINYALKKLNLDKSVSLTHQYNSREQALTYLQQLS
jgi:sulfate permease, SulP family